MKHRVTFNNDYKNNFFHGVKGIMFEPGEIINFSVPIATDCSIHVQSDDVELTRVNCESYDLAYSFIMPDCDVNISISMENNMINKKNNGGFKMKDFIQMTNQNREVVFDQFDESGQYVTCHICNNKTPSDKKFCQHCGSVLNIKDNRNYFLAIYGSSIDSFYQADEYPSEGDFTHAKFVGSSAGCCPLNVSAVVASKGVKVKALDMLAKNDSTTDFLLSELTRLNIDISNIEQQEGVINSQVIIITTNDKRTMFVVDPIRPYYQMTEQKQKLLNNSKYIYSLLHMINRSFASIDPLLQAKKAGAKIIIDGTSKYDDSSRVEMLYKLVDGLFINTTDYQRLKEHSNGEPTEIILQNGGQFVVVTDGSKGATLYTNEGKYFAESVKNVNVVDSTGAGDSFAGGFLAALMNGYDYQKALKYATLSGGYCCEKIGGLAAVCSFDDLEHFAKEHDYDL